MTSLDHATWNIFGFEDATCIVSSKPRGLVGHQTWGWHFAEESRLEDHATERAVEKLMKKSSPVSMTNLLAPPSWFIGEPGESAPVL